MSTDLIERTETEVEKWAADLLSQVNALVIVTNGDRVDAEALIQDLSAAEKKRFAYLDPERKRAYENYLHHKQRLDDAINPLIAARKAAKQKCIQWDAEQERIRREEERILAEEARKRAEEEALAAAIQAAAEGDTEAVEAILEAPLEVAPVTVPKSAPAPSRLSAGREIWSAEVTNLMALVKAVAEGKQPIIYLLPNMPALNKQATSLKQHMAIPGTKPIMKKV